MGTETSPPSGAYKMIGIVYVKLNNPLMGTETIKPSIYSRFLVA